MTKVNKMFKTITVFVALAMLVALLPVSVAAANTVTIDAEEQYSTTDPIVVTGNIASGNELTILAVRTGEAVTGDATEVLGMLESIDDGDIMYIDQVTSSGADVEFSFRLRNDENATTTGNYLVVFMGGTDADAVYACAELVKGAPEDLALSEDSYTGNVKFTFTDDADWREKVVVTATGVDGAIEAVTNVAGEITLPLAAGTYDITFTAAGYTDKVVPGVVVADRTAGTATLNVPDRGYYFDSDEITLTLAGGHADWATALVDAGIEIWLADDSVTAGTYADGVITVEGTGEYKVKFNAIAGYGSIEDIAFEVKSFGQAVADAAIAAVTSAANAEDEEGLTWLIEVPAEADLADDFAGEYTFAWVIDPEVAPAENVYTITRPENLDENEDESVTYTLTLTVTYADEDYIAEKAFVVNEQGEDGPEFAAENVEVIGTNVYKMTGKSVVIVKHEEVDATTTSILVDGVKLYYFPVRGAFVGVIDTVTVDALISGKKITTEASIPAVLYSGVAMEKTSNVSKATLNDGLLACRYGAGLTEIVPPALASSWKLLGTTDTVNYDETAWLLACDVTNNLREDGEFVGAMDGKVTMNDALLIKRVGAGVDAKFAIDPAQE